jgi:hypothetical protein
MAERLPGRAARARSGGVGTAGAARAASAGDGADRTAGELVGAVRAGKLPMALEKLVALAELGGERGLELVQGVVGRRTGRAA